MIEVVAAPAVGPIRTWLGHRIDETWGGMVARLDEIVDPRSLPAYVALLDGEPVGAITLSVHAQRCEIVTIEAMVRRQGVGSALVRRAVEHTRDAGAHDLWLITTNDNTDAIAFYDASGFTLVTRHAGAVDRARRTLKPTIPVVGANGVPIRDELEFRLGL